MADLFPWSSVGSPVAWFTLAVTSNWGGPFVPSRLDSFGSIQSQYYCARTVHGRLRPFHNLLQRNELYVFRCVRCGVRTFRIAALSPMVFMNARGWP